MASRIKKEVWDACNPMALRDVAHAFSILVDGGGHRSVRFLHLVSALHQNKDKVHPIVLSETAKATRLILRSWKLDGDSVLSNTTLLQFWKDMNPEQIAKK